MAQMRLRTRITLAFVSILILLAAIAIVAVVYLGRTADGIEQYRNWARDANLVNDAQIELVNARMSLKDFLLRGTSEERQAYQERYDQFRSLLTESQQEIANPERAALLDEMVGQADQYASSFEEVARHVGDRNQGIDELDQYGPQAEDTLSEIMIAAAADGDLAATLQAGLAIRSLQTLRLRGFRFFEESTPALEQEVRDELDSFNSYMTALNAELQNPQRRALLSEAQALASSWERTFDNIVQAAYARDTTVATELEVAGDSIAADGQQVIASVTTDQETLGPELQAAAQFATFLVVGVGIAAILLGLLISVLITRSTLRQLGEDPKILGDIADRVAKGDLDIERADDPVGVYAAVQEMVASLRYKADRLEQMAQRDFTVEITKASDLDTLGESMIVMRDALREVLVGVKSAAEQVAAGSGQVSSASQELSQGATESASSLEEISSSVNQVNGQSRQNSDNATEANNIAKEAASNATSGNDQMNQLKEAMANISHSSDEIKKIVKVIDDIAFQINLLALNANVEAARAGKYGKGFAVVAEEVRNLAVRSADAVQETTAMVNESVRNIENGNELTDTTAAQLAEIVTGSTRVAEFLEEIAAASKEQALAVEQVTEGLSQVDQVTQANTASAEESASAAEELASQAEELRASVANFQLGAEEGAHALAAPARSSASTPVSDTGHAGANGNGHQRQEKVATQPSAASRRQAEQPKDVIQLDDDEFDRF